MAHLLAGVAELRRETELGVLVWCWDNYVAYRCHGCWSQPLVDAFLSLPMPLTEDELWSAIQQALQKRQKDVWPAVWTFVHIGCRSLDNLSKLANQQAEDGCTLLYLAMEVNLPLPLGETGLQTSLYTLLRPACPA